MTGVVTLDDLDDSVAGTAHLFQARVDKTADVRAVLIGAEVFYVRIESGGLLDWRVDYSALRYSVLRPPACLDAALKAFAKRFGLVFAAFDLALTPDGRYVFLECNPSGQYAWLEPETGLPLVARVADLLERASS